MRNFYTLESRTTLETLRLYGSSFGKVAIFLIFLLSSDSSLYSQCTWYNNNTGCTTNAPTVVGATINCTPPNNNGGRRNFVVNNMIEGCTYRISNCGSGYDTQMTIRNSSGTVFGYNDDYGPACNTLQAASIDFVCPANGQYWIQLNRYNCFTIADVLNGTISVTLQSCAPLQNMVPLNGNNSYTLCSGVLYDHAGSAGNYVSDANGYSVINSATAGYMVQLSGNITTELNYDFVKIYNGVGTGGTLLYQGSGTESIGTITSTSGPLTVQFTSDEIIVNTGFALSITCVPPCVPTGDQTAYGASSWIGYVYDAATPGAFTTYKGIVTEATTFNRTHSTIAAGATAQHCSVSSNLFTIRYKNTTNFQAGYYTFSVGGDDGVRFSIDGGATWLINKWLDQIYTVWQNPTPVYLSGNTNMVFEYFENMGLAQSSFSYIFTPANFSSCNLVVYKVGDGTTSLSNSAFPVSIDEINPINGAVSQTLTTQFTGSNLLTQSGSAVSVGMLNSYNGYLSVPGYSSSIGTSLPSNNKANSIIDGSTSVLTYTSSVFPFGSSNHLRSTLPVSSNTFYATGASGGLHYYNGTTFVQTSNTVSNIRNIEIFNGNLYFSTGATGIEGIYQVGSGLPTSSGQPASLIVPTPSPYGFSISPDGCTMYVADNSSPSNGGVQKWAKVSGTWQFQYIISSILCLGLVCDYSSTNPIIYVTTNENSNNKIVKIIDNGSSASVLTTVLLLSGTKYAFRGIDFTPNSYKPITISQQPVSASYCQNTTTIAPLSLSATSSGSISYQWYSNTTNDYCGATAILGATSVSYLPSVNTVGTKYYFVKMKSSCATIVNSAIAVITLNPLIIPTFTEVSPYCFGAAIPALPLTSNNSIAGTWSPATVSTNTTGTYTFTPTAGQCATTTTKVITITQLTQPTILCYQTATWNPVTCIWDITGIQLSPIFNPVGPFCSGTTISSLPTLSTNGIVGTWSPAINNIATTTYTFIPTAGICATNQTMSITITPNTTPTFSQVPPVCFGDLIPPLPTTSLNGFSGTWSPAINNTDTTTYTFTPGIGQCSTDETMTIIVYPQVQVSITDTSICNGGTATLIATVTPAGGTYFWSNASPTSSITVSPTFLTTYSVLYTSLNNCSATASRPLAVNPIPTVTATSALICDGEIATIVATGLPTGGTYLWSPSGQITASINVSPSSTANYSVVYSRLGCESQAVNTVVTVNPVPILNLASEVICIGEEITMTAQTTIAGGVYDWGNGNANETQTFSPLSDTTLTLSYSVNGCTSPIETATITVNPLPISTFSGSPLTGCIPLEVTLLADDNSNTSYSWLASNGLTGTGAQSSLSFTNEGFYNITLTAGLNGCSTTTTINNYVTVDNYPIASFVPSSNKFIELTQLLEFTNTSSGAESYSWDFGDGASSTEINPEHNFTDNLYGHVITLTAYSQFFCANIDSVQILFNNSLIYYIPNTFTPDGDGHNQTFKPVFTSGFDPYNYEMLIYNRWGEIIFETHDVTYGWDGTYAFENSTCQDGIYTYKITFKNPILDERKVVCGSVNLLK